MTGKLKLRVSHQGNMQYIIARESQPMTLNMARTSFSHMLDDPLFVDEAEQNLRRYLETSGQELASINPELTEEMLGELKAIRTKRLRVEEVKNLLACAKPLQDEAIALTSDVPLRLVEAIGHLNDVGGWETTQKGLADSVAKLDARRRAIAQTLGIEVL